ncbi:SpoIIE family protein phosphatase [Hydrogenophaga sp.]|uniref:PP2C family protein-serine/threonine phosphatase n=1 Tax=Hydrogenophaga sp. TaxID=1904254 RepID=UPI0025C3FD10|nr:SpoIIE family protein phosphatase [Hydrogenophaga sp.]MBT9466680.1 SpoIIE family protein phosphatase [Hydrogenophaga sp.]
MRLLVVDDLEINRDLLVRRVRRLGHEADVAVNGQEALEKLRAASWDLVLLDITMPVMDGYDTLRHIKADPLLADIPVVMVSAIDETDSVVRCLELGADDYLTKPFNPIILQARIESSLAKKRLADQQRLLLQALSREMHIGQRIQQGFLPEAMPVLAGWDLAGCCVPARQVSGDFYDAFMLPNGRLALIVADVCDKGVGAALYMALFRTLLRAMSCHAGASEASHETLSRTVDFTNDYIAGVHGRESMFATVFFAILDPASGHLDYVNAGQDAPMVKRGSGGEVVRLPSSGGAVGLLPGIRCSVQAFDLQPGDGLFAFTDGVTEAVGDTGEFGEAALLHEIAAAGPQALSYLASIQSRMAMHVGSHNPHDDVTMLCVVRAAG